VQPCDKDEGKNYKISMDPYRKRVSIEEYEKKAFTRIIYDSAIFDFRHLKPEEQTAWQKITIEETETLTKALIRNQDDRLILSETYHFKEGVCRKSFAHSPHGIPISHQELLYRHLGDAFNGIIMYDDNNHPIMFKVYEFDENTQEFTKLLEQHWNMQKTLLPVKRLSHGRNQM